MSQAQTFDIKRHLLSFPSTGRIAEVARCLRSQERILPMSLNETITSFAANVAMHAPQHLLLRAIADIWMPTKRLFLQFPCSTGAVGIFAEVQEDQTVDVLHLAADADGVRAAPFTTHLRAAAPRPNVDWAGIRDGRWEEADPELWFSWAESSLRLTCHDAEMTAHDINQWSDEVLLRDLFTFVLGLSFLGRRTLHATGQNGSEIPMDGGHV